MKVIEHGDSFKIVKCDKCNCTIAYTEKDIIEDVGIRKWIRCPECDREIEI